MSNLLPHRVVVSSSLTADQIDSINYKIYPLAMLDNIQGQLSSVLVFIVDYREFVKLAPPILNSGYSIPWVVIAPQSELFNLDLTTIYSKAKIYVITNREDFKSTLEQAIAEYSEIPRSEFFSLLKEYAQERVSTFACPGHQEGNFFRKHPLGKEFYDYFGANIFKSDVCNADLKLGDLLIHQGAAKQAQKNAAKIYQADKTYFVLNGTSAANKVIANALLTADDLVLFDRNNHKSCHAGALIQTGATPIYLETSRNAYGFIGGIYDSCFDEKYIRELIDKQSPQHANLPRPFRLAIIQLGTYDGTLSNPQNIIQKIGHLCEYILFDSAWVGYEAFVNLLVDRNPLALELGAEDPGIIVTQSIHKQQAGFSQASQIHKKDAHIKGQSRYLDHKRLNNSFMLHASTSPFYPIFASIDVNAAIHGSNIGINLWIDCLIEGIQFRKNLLTKSKYIKPFVDSNLWNKFPAHVIAGDKQFFAFVPEEKWHNFAGYSKDQYLLDPFKLLCTTPGIDVVSNKYQAVGIPANVLANYLREQGIIPEKSDLNSILFLSTPSQDKYKLDLLLEAILQFEQHYDNNSPLSIVLPSIYYAHQEKYQGLCLGDLCQQMHQLYCDLDIKTIQTNLFRKDYFPSIVINPQQANIELIKNNVTLIKVAQAQGKIAAVGALPYPPGVYVVVGGERWSQTAVDYFLALEKIINIFPGFASEIQGVYMEEEVVDGKVVQIAYAYVVNED